MEQIWFVFSNNETVGPLSTSDVEKILQSSDPTKIYIWCRRIKHWMNATQWQAQHKEILSHLKSNIDFNRSWYFLKGKDVEGPLTQNELIQQLKLQSTLARIRVWGFGMQYWKSVFEYPLLVKELNIDQRTYPRIVATGVAMITKFNQDHIRPLTTLGEGGFGIQSGQFVSKGETLKTTLQCEELAFPIHCMAEVKSIDSKGNAGFQFKHIESRDLNLIHSLVHEIISQKIHQKIA